MIRFNLVKLSNTSSLIARQNLLFPLTSGINNRRLYSAPSNNNNTTTTNSNNPVNTTTTDANNNTAIINKSIKKKDPLWVRIKHEVKHYATGTKLLGYEIKISTKLLIKYVQGYELTRRENNQLKRTMSDIFRLVPFSAFVIIPFAELLLPIALKLFPNLLPSTYESGSQRLQKNKKLVEIRQLTSKLLHETMDNKKLLLNFNNIDNLESKKIFYNFFNKLYQAKRIPSKTTYFTHNEINSIAKLFKNDTVLDNLNREQLTAMSKFMSLTPFGSDNMLRYQIRSNLKKIMNDDIIIDYENVDSLTNDELYNACVKRGMKCFGGVKSNELRDNLNVWLHLRLRERIPSVLLMLTSTFIFGKKELTNVNLKSISLPDKNINEIDESVLKQQEKDLTNYDKILNLYYDGILQVLNTMPDSVYNLAKLDIVESIKIDEKKSKKDSKKLSISKAIKEEIEPIKVSSVALLKETKPNNNMPLSSPSSEIPIENAITHKPITDATIVEECKTTEEQEEVEEDIDQESKDNEFKLSVLKEQEALIEKEEQDAKLRKTTIKEDTIDLNEDK